MPTMDDSVSAALSIQGDALRFVELRRQDGDEPRLARAGTLRFPFDLGEALLREDGTSSHLRRVREALADALGDTPARTLQVAIHPPDGYSFFTPISSDVPVRDRKRQLLQQTALVTGVRSTKELHLTSETVRTTQDSEGEPFMWVHVLAVPDAVDRRMGDLVGALPPREYTWIVSSEAVSRVTARIERAGGSAEEALRPYTLVVGQYPTHTEYALSRNRDWYHAHYAEEARSPENRAYFAVGFLNRVGVPLDGVGRLFVYGVDLDVGAYAPFEQIFGQAPEVLDPVRVVGAGPEGPLDAPGAFAPCVGAAMGSYL